MNSLPDDPNAAACDNLAKAIQHLPCRTEYGIARRIGGEDHRPLFKCDLTLSPQGVTSSGSGSSKLAARRAAAAAMMASLEARGVISRDPTQTLYYVDREPDPDFQPDREEGEQQEQPQQSIIKEPNHLRIVTSDITRVGHYGRATARRIKSPSIANHTHPNIPQTSNPYRRPLTHSRSTAQNPDKKHSTVQGNQTSRYQTSFLDGPPRQQSSAKPNKPTNQPQLSRAPANSRDLDLDSVRGPIALDSEPLPNIMRRPLHATATRPFTGGSLAPLSHTTPPVNHNNAPPHSLQREPLPKSSLPQRDGVKPSQIAPASSREPVARKSTESVHPTQGVALRSASTKNELGRRATSPIGPSSRGRKMPPFAPTKSRISGSSSKPKVSPSIEKTKTSEALGGVTKQEDRVAQKPTFPQGTAGTVPSIALNPSSPKKGKGKGSDANVGATSRPSKPTSLTPRSMPTNLPGSAPASVPRSEPTSTCTPAPAASKPTPVVVPANKKGSTLTPASRPETPLNVVTAHSSVPKPAEEKPAMPLRSVAVPTKAHPSAKVSPSDAGQVARGLSNATGVQPRRAGSGQQLSSAKSVSQKPTPDKNLVSKGEKTSNTGRSAENHAVRATTTKQTARCISQMERGSRKVQEVHGKSSRLDASKLEGLPKEQLLRHAPVKRGSTQKVDLRLPPTPEKTNMPTLKKITLSGEMGNPSHDVLPKEARRIDERRAIQGKTKSSAPLKGNTAKRAKEQDASTPDQERPTTREAEEDVGKAKTETTCEARREEARKTVAPQDSDSDSAGDVVLRRISRPPKKRQKRKARSPVQSAKSSKRRLSQGSAAGNSTETDGEVIPLRKRARKMASELPSNVIQLPHNVKLTILVDLNVLWAKNQVSKLLTSKLLVDLFFLLFGGKLEAGGSAKSVLNLTNGEEDMVLNENKGTTATMIAFEVGKRYGTLLIERSEHMAKGGLSGLSPRMLIICDDPSLDSLKLKDGIEVFNGKGTLLSTWIQRLLQSARTELVDAKLKSRK